MVMNAPLRRAKVAVSEQNPERHQERREREQPQRLDLDGAQQQHFTQRRDDRDLDHDVHRDVVIAQIDDDQTLELHQDEHDQGVGEGRAEVEPGSEELSAQLEQDARRDAEEQQREADGDEILRRLEKTAHSIVHVRVRDGIA
jgi:hypothetical protein